MLLAKWRMHRDPSRRLANVRALRGRPVLSKRRTCQVSGDPSFILRVRAQQATTIAQRSSPHIRCYATGATARIVEGEDAVLKYNFTAFLYPCCLDQCVCMFYDYSSRLPHRPARMTADSYRGTAWQSSPALFVAPSTIDVLCAQQHWGHSWFWPSRHGKRPQPRKRRSAATA